MLPKKVVDRREYFERCNAEAERILKRFEIAQPRCGFGAGLGWIPSVERALEKMVAAGWTKQLAQVKQKFCQLRIYIDERTHYNPENVLKKAVRAVMDKIQWRLERYRPFRKILRGGLWSIKLFGPVKWLPNEIGKAIDEAEAECDRLCEVCGKEREKKGPRSGWALCNACGEEDS